MFYRQLLLSALLLITCKQIYCRECSDCMEYTSCAAAKYLAENRPGIRTSAIFRFTKCNANRQTTVWTVCCSLFPPVPTNLISKFQSIKKEDLLPNDCGISNSGDRIVGGTEAEINEFPWMVLLKYKTRSGDEFDCGGTIINSRYILTAAHCTTDRYKIVSEVRVGEYDISSPDYCSISATDVTCEGLTQDIPIEKVIPHEDYALADTARFARNVSGPKNDIALLRLAKPIQLNNENVKAICLPITDNLRHINLERLRGYVAGWGFTESGNKSNKLLKVNLPVMRKKDCEESFYSNDLDKQFCAGSLKKDSCGGDSGGPFMLQENYKDNPGRYVQFGVVSYGPGLCGHYRPGVYTDVREYVDWILDNIEE